MFLVIQRILLAVLLKLMYDLVTFSSPVEVAPLKVLDLYFPLPCCKVIVQYLGKSVQCLIRHFKQDILRINMALLRRAVVSRYELDLVQLVLRNQLFYFWWCDNLRYEINSVGDTY